MVTADALFLSVDVHDKRAGISALDQEEFNDFSLHLIFPIVVGRVHVVANLDVHFAGRQLVVKATVATFLRLTQGRDHQKHLPAKSNYEFALASEG